jgi:hypothetical protein
MSVQAITSPGFWYSAVSLSFASRRLHYTTLQALQCRTVGWQVNIELERIWREASWPIRAIIPIFARRDNGNHKYVVTTADVPVEIRTKHAPSPARRIQAMSVSATPAKVTSVDKVNWTRSWCPRLLHFLLTIIFSNAFQWPIITPEGVPSIPPCSPPSCSLQPVN